MRELWEQVLEGYGQWVSLSREGGETRVKALFQPGEEKREGETPSPLGMAPVGRYLYLGPAGESLEDVREVGWNGRAFRLVRRREYWVGREKVYWWGLLEERDEAAGASPRPTEGVRPDGSSGPTGSWS